MLKTLWRANEQFAWNKIHTTADDSRNDPCWVHLFYDFQSPLKSWKQPRGLAAEVADTAGRDPRGPTGSERVGSIGIEDHSQRHKLEAYRWVPR